MHKFQAVIPAKLVPDSDPGAGIRVFLAPYSEVLVTKNKKMLVRG